MGIDHNLGISFMMQSVIVNKDIYQYESTRTNIKNTINDGINH